MSLWHLLNIAAVCCQISSSFFFLKPIYNLKNERRTLTTHVFSRSKYDKSCFSRTFSRSSSSSNPEKRGDETGFDEDRNGNPEGRIEMNSLADNIPLIDEDEDMNQVLFYTEIRSVNIE